MANWIAIGIVILSFFVVLVNGVQKKRDTNTNVRHVFIYCYAFNFTALVILLNVLSEPLLEIAGTAVFSITMFLNAAEYANPAVNLILNLLLPLGLLLLAASESNHHGETAPLQVAKILATISVVSLFLNELNIPFDA
jgi:ABC-type transport system involved in multi-copper enzyme maturation permease subunit